jgi:uncharacterized protein (DUF1800 family)
MNKETTRFLSRRDCLTVGSAAALLAGCAPIARRFVTHPEDLPLPTGDIHPTVRLLNRTGFGPRPGDVARVEKTGHAAYIDSLLKADIPEDLGLQMQLQRLDVGQIDDPDIEDLPRAEVIRQLQQAAILQAVYGANPLKERMVDFWTNHFNVYALKGDSAFRKGGDERAVIRDHALGNFGDLVRSSSRSPAMIAFLDNTQNFKLHPNENYARELMELHTLGIGGGYTQKDVQEVARCFTGWTVETRFLRPKGKIRFDPDLHDDGRKTVLGHTIPAGGGEKDAQLVLNILCAHPSTAHFISAKLVRYFHGQEDSALISRAADEFSKSSGDIPSVLRVILDPVRLGASPPIVKRPFHLIASALRATGGDTDGNNGIQKHLIDMGEPLYQWPMPDGYPVKTTAWTGSMLPRFNFAQAYATDSIPGTSLGSVKDPFISSHQRRPQDSDGLLLNALRGKKPEQALALCLAAPSFQWY